MAISINDVRKLEEKYNLSKEDCVAVETWFDKVIINDHELTYDELDNILYEDYA